MAVLYRRRRSLTIFLAVNVREAFIQDRTLKQVSILAIDYSP